MSQPVISTTPSTGLPRIASSTSIEARFRNSIAVGRRLRFAGREHRELEREAAGLVDPALDPLGELAEVGVAGGELGEGVADPDHRPAVEQIGREPLVLHPAAMQETVPIRMPEPGGAAQRFLLVGGHCEVLPGRRGDGGEHTRRVSGIPRPSQPARHQDLQLPGWCGTIAGNGGGSGATMADGESGAARISAEEFQELAWQGVPYVGQLGCEVERFDGRRRADPPALHATSCSGPAGRSAARR